ncbi:MAG TPA: hypothetical protein VF541_10205 [Longimicrobium sp.]|jgi:hypothetical protein
MLTIRDAQMEAFAAAAVRRFEAEMVAHLRSREGGAGGWDEAELHAFVKEGIAQARVWGIDGRADVRVLLEWRRDLAPAFQREEVRAVLEDRFLAGFSKIQRVRELLAPREG